VPIYRGYEQLSMQQFRQWLQHYIQYGQLPAATNSCCSKRRFKRKVFTDDDNKILGNIINTSPQLYWDEIANELFRQTGKRWNASSIWRHMTTKLEYSLQVAIFCAQQAQVHKQEAFWLRLIQNVHNIEQIIVLDETHKSRNASRRRRAWAKKGHTPVLPTYFEEYF